ncbi:P-type conjugative transfer protein TrbG [Phenylobacterium sp.]|uniref:P-type conjugative transfer protein TrbG n=1 Tax=Phenylobacterium sp. TaxID=1871053 RepID=UPI003D2BC1E4
MRRPLSIVLAATAMPALAACASLQPAPAAASEIAAVRLPDPPRKLVVMPVPTPLPLPGQLKPLATAPAPDLRSPPTRVAAANAAARVEPSQAGYVNGVQVYPWTEGALYQVYAAPGRVTDIALQPGEQLAGTGPVAAGDTVRWIIGDTESGQGIGRRVHILVKPTDAKLVTNLVINTDRRTYHLELRATPEAYMASVSWRYPQDDLLALRTAAQADAAARPVAQGIDLDRLNFDYRIEGRASWRPIRVFDDGRQVFIEFPGGVSQGEMPPLFIRGAEGAAELVNYRVSGRRMIVDRLFQAAELRLGGRNDRQRVTIRRIGAP